MAPDSGFGFFRAPKKNAITFCVKNFRYENDNSTPQNNNRLTDFSPSLPLTWVEKVGGREGEKSAGCYSEVSKLSRFGVSRNRIMAMRILIVADVFYSMVSEIGAPKPNQTDATASPPTTSKL